jgi:hypothetical protein
LRVAQGGFNGTTQVFPLTQEPRRSVRIPVLSGLLTMKRFRVYIQKVDEFVAELSYEDDELTELSHDELLAAAANDVSEQGLGNWDFMESNTTALSVCEILEDGTEGEAWEINTEV